MAHQFSPTVEQLIREKMASGRYSSEEELLLDALHSPEGNEEELRAIQEGIDSVEPGNEGVALDQAFEKIREMHRAR
jgi:hypothetical protein